MILRELLYKGPRCIVPRTAEVPAVPTGCYQIFIKLFIKNGLLLIKIIKKIIYGEVFYWFVLLIKLFNY